jgi:AhpC/TSA family
VRALAAVALALLAAGCARPPPPRSAPIPSLGRAGGFTVPDDGGDLTPVPSPGPRATVLELWATDCRACRPALAALAREAPRLQADDIAWVLLGVLDEGEPLDRAREVLREWGVERPFLVDRGGGVQRGLGIDALPATVVLDRRGVVRWAAPAGASAREVAAAARWVAGR